MAWFPAKAWTSQRAVGGYRHFQLVTQGGQGDQRWVELSAVLEPAHRERVLWRDLNDADHTGAVVGSRSLKTTMT